MSVELQVNQDTALSYSSIYMHIYVYLCVYVCVYGYIEKCLEITHSDKKVKTEIPLWKC